MSDEPVKRIDGAIARQHVEGMGMGALAKMVMLTVGYWALSKPTAIRGITLGDPIQGGDDLLVSHGIVSWRSGGETVIVFQTCPAAMRLSVTVSGEEIDLPVVRLSDINGPDPAGILDGLLMVHSDEIRGVFNSLEKLTEGEQHG